MRIVLRGWFFGWFFLFAQSELFTLFFASNVFGAWPHTWEMLTLVSVLFVGMLLLVFRPWATTSSLISAPGSSVPTGGNAKATPSTAVASAAKAQTAVSVAKTDARPETELVTTSTKKPTTLREAIRASQGRQDAFSKIFEDLSTNPPSEIIPSVLYVDR
jgi:hypothetical protein